MKNGLLALLVVGVVLSGLAAGTWAYFDDTETSSGNYIAAGTLDLEVNGVGTFDVSIGEDGIGPGDSDSWDITVQNAGTVDGTLTLKFTNYDYTEGTPSTVHPSGSHDLGDVTYITLYLDGNPFDISGLDDNGDGHVSLSELKDQVINLGALTAGSSETLTVSWEIDSNADNGIQGDTIQFDIEFALTQS